MAVANVVAKFEADISDVQAKMATLKKSFSDAGDSSQQLSQRFKTVGAEMSRVGKGMTIGLTLPLAAVGAAAVKASVDFESSMSKIVGLVGIAADEVNAMKAEVIAMSGETAKSPVELANALFVVTSAGLRGAEAMETLDMSARAGAAGLGDTSDIARAVAGALSAYGSEVLSASDATDQIVATARAGNFETSQFAAAIGRVLPFAQQAGATFADMGGAVALLTRVNGNAAQSVTQMAALFRAFVVPTEEAKKGLQDVGLSAQQLRDSIAKQGLPATLQMLDKALGGNREQLGRILGSSEAASAAFQILGADSKVLSETFGVVADSAGMTDEAFDAAANTAGFKMQQAMVSLQGTLIQIGDIIVPLVTEFAKFAKTLLDGFQSLPGPVKSLAVVFAGVVAVLGPMLWIGGKVIAMFGTMAGAANLLKTKTATAFASMRASVTAFEIKLKTAMIAASTQMGAFSAAVRVTAGGVVRTMGAAAKGLLAALGPVGIGLIALTVAFEVFSNNSAEAEQKAYDYAEALDAVTGAATETSNELVLLNLLSAELQGFGIGAGPGGWLGLSKIGFKDLATQAGLSLNQIATAVQGSSDEYESLVNSINAAVAANKVSGAEGEALIKTLEKERVGIEDVRVELEKKTQVQRLGIEPTLAVTSATVGFALATGKAIGPTQGYA